MASTFWGASPRRTLLTLASGTERGQRGKSSHHEVGRTERLKDTGVTYTNSITVYELKTVFRVTMIHDKKPYTHKTNINGCNKLY